MVLLGLLAVAMAIGTFRGSGLVEQHIVPRHDVRQRVTAGTRNSLMRPLQRESRSPVVIKIRGLPAVDVMATGTICDVPAGCKLSRVGIAMTSGTLHRRGPKIHVLHGGLQGRRPMAIDTHHASVRAN